MRIWNILYLKNLSFEYRFCKSFKISIRDTTSVMPTPTSAKQKIKGKIACRRLWSREVDSNTNSEVGVDKMVLVQHWILTTYQTVLGQLRSRSRQHKRSKKKQLADDFGVEESTLTLTLTPESELKSESIKWIWPNTFIRISGK